MRTNAGKTRLGILLAVIMAAMLIALGVAAAESAPSVADIREAYLTCAYTELPVGEETQWELHWDGPDMSGYKVSYTVYRKDYDDGGRHYSSAEMGTIEETSFTLTFSEAGRYMIVLEITDAAGNTIVNDDCMLPTESAEDSALKKKVAEIVQACKDAGKTGKDAALFLHNAIVNGAEYSTDSDEPEGVLLEGGGTCQSYSKAYRMLLNEMGIKNIIISGQAYDGESYGDHMWNLIQIGGNWYHVDCCFDDPVNGPEDTRYFMITDSSMGQDHSWNPELYPECATKGEAAISQETLLMYEGSLIGNYWTPTIAVIQDGLACENVSWTSDNEKVLKVDENGCVIWMGGYGPATLTGTLDGKSYVCSAEVREIRMYVWFEYTGSKDESLWIWDYAMSMSVGQTVPYRLEELRYDKDGKITSQEDVTEKYPLAPAKPECFEITNGSVKALIAGTSQEAGNSQTYSYIENDQLSVQQYLFFNIFTGTVEDVKDKLMIERNEGEHYFYLTTNEYVGTFPIEPDDLFITAADFHCYRCQPGEFTWKSSDPDIVELAGTAGGSRPGHIYSTIAYTAKKAGKVTISVEFGGQEIASFAFEMEGGASGWQEGEDGMYYIGADGELLKNGVFTVDGKMYYFDENGKMLIGFRQPEGEEDWYCADENGVLYAGGWTELEGDYYYFEPDGRMKRNSWLEENGEKYYLTSWGTLLKDGTYNIDGVSYTFDKDGKLQHTPVAEWRQESGGYRYYIDGAMQTGWVQEGQKWYYLGADGYMATGWKQLGAWYYFGSDGAMQTGWLNDGGAWYYFSSDGAMQTGWVQDGQNWYYMNGGGAMTTGWLQQGGTWYLLGGNGVMRTGWVQDGGAWYYFSSGGAMETGWTKIRGDWYFFEGSGTMKTGWLKDRGEWFYFEPNGKMTKGWKEIREEQRSYWYYFKDSGAMATEWEEIGGKWEYFDASGVWQYTWDGN